MESIEVIKENRILVTGGAGFIGSNLADALLEAGKEVVVLDNFSTGQPRFLQQAETNPNFTLVRGDLLNESDVERAIEGCGVVFHLAANADIRFGFDHPRKDLEQNTIATFNLLEAMRKHCVRRIAFASSSAALGEPEIFPTPENCPVPIQTSLYGASKMACEGMISAYCEGAGMEGYVFRFVSLLGNRYPHGHVYDFVKGLRTDPTRLKILGDGSQRKSFLNIKDCVAAIMHVVGNETASKTKHHFDVFNLGYPEFIHIKHSIQWICERLGVSPQFDYTGGQRGWVGDSPFVFLNTAKILATGWKPSITIQNSIYETVDWLQANAWIFDTRK
jgi:UDP-glucose 4-epimerase